MRRLPTILSALFILITLARVASFASRHMHAGALGWVFAAVVIGGVYTSAYWLRMKDPAIVRAGRIGVIAFGLADAFFNWADVWLSADVSTPLLAIGAHVYGVLPTLAVGILALMQGAIDKLPPTKAQSANNAALTAIGAAALRRVREWIETPAVKAQPVAEPVHACKLCGWSPQASKDARKSYSAHCRGAQHKANVRRNGHEKEKAIA
jgi:hypothetical protein